jgi:hypothetical protein
MSFKYTAFNVYLISSTIDSISEQKICSIIQIMSFKVEPNQQDWVNKVPLTKFAINLALASQVGLHPLSSLMNTRRAF